MGKNIAQKIFDEHIIEKKTDDTYIIKLDLVCCHEITTPSAIMDLVKRNKDKVFDKDKIKAVIDHVTPAKDSKTATQGKILRDWARRHDIKDFFDIGSNGVCHALFPEKGFILPGYVAIMGDSHTCTYGAFSSFAAGVGTTDLEVGILKGVCAFSYPKTIKIVLTGQTQKNVYAKDIILFIIGELGVNGATNKIIEFSGEAVDNMSMEERMTICNMVVEAGATSGICKSDMTLVNYLWESIKNKYSSKEEALSKFSKYNADEDAEYDKVIEYNVNTIEPLTTYGFKPDNVKKISEMGDVKIDQVYIGSCTNGRLEDLRIAANILKGKKIHPEVRGIVSPATPKVYSDALKEGIIEIFMEAGFCITNPTCGACLGMSNGVMAEGEVCASTTNRNFNGRMGKGAMIHLMSPASAAASAISGKITTI